MQKTLAHASTLSYASLKQQHIADYQSYFDRVHLDLGHSDKLLLPTDQRLGQYGDGKADPAFAVLFYQFGRYLLISSSRPDNPLPSNSQGLWGDGLDLPWKCDYKSNINFQMNYWPVETANLSACHLPMIRTVEDLVAPGQKTARAYYNAPGWFYAYTTNAWGWTAPGGGLPWGVWTGGQRLGLPAPVGALCVHAGPRLSQACLPGHERRRRVLSWRHDPGRRRVFGHVPVHLAGESVPGRSGRRRAVSPRARRPSARSSGICSRTWSRRRRRWGKTPRSAPQVEAALAKMRPLQIGKAGQLEEWPKDWDMNSTDPHHRHISHLFALHPGHQISALTTPELAAAARTTLEQRGDEGTGWSKAWKINCWARLHDGDHAFRLLSEQLRTGDDNDDQLRRGRRHLREPV